MMPITMNTDLSELAENTLQHIREKKILTSSKLSEEIQALEPQNLKIFVDKVIASLTKEKNALALIEGFAKLISTANLEESARRDFPMLESVLATASLMQPLAKDYLEMTGNYPPSTTLSIKLCRARDFLVSLFEGVLESFGLINLFDYNDNSQTKENKILALFALISTASAILIPLLGLSHGFLAVALIGFILVAAGQTYLLIRPMPVRLPDMENWTKKYWEGRLRIPSYTPKECSILASALAPGRPAILCGPSGSGKTELAKAFVRDVSQGKHLHLKGKRIFYVNAATIPPDKLQNINRNMGRHRNDIIVIFDQLQDADTKLINQLKFMLRNSTSFPYFVGIATTPECIDIGSTITVSGTDIEETKSILHHAALQYPNVLLDIKACEKIAEKSLKASGANPRAAKELLSSCVHRTSRTQLSLLEQKIDTLREQIRSSAAQKIAGNAPSFLPYGKKQEANLEVEELTTLEKQLEAEKTKREAFFTLREQLQKIKIAIHQATLKLNPKSSNKDKNVYLLLSHYFLPAFEQFLKEEASRLDLKIEINEDLIEEEKTPPH